VRWKRVQRVKASLTWMTTRGREDHETDDACAHL
jgi:hypothetical protein